jgi:hypothetical protein
MSVSSTDECKIIYTIINLFLLASFYGQKNLEESMVYNLFPDVPTYIKVLEIIMTYQDFSLLHIVQTGSGTLLASYSTDPAEIYRRVKRPGCESDHSPP